MLVESRERLHELPDTPPCKIAHTVYYDIMYISLRNSRSCSCFQASHIGQVAFASSITNPRLELRGSRFTSNYKSRLGLLCSAVLCFELSHKKFSVKMGVYTACCHAVFCRLSVCLSHVCLPTAVPGVDIMGHHRLPAYRAHINCTDNNSSHHSSLLWHTHSPQKVTI